MASELKNNLQKAIGKQALLFLENGFRFKGKILSCDGEFLKIQDYKIRAEKLIRLDQISEVNFYE